MADFEHLYVRSALGELAEGVRLNDTAPDLAGEIDDLWHSVYDLDSTSAARRIRKVTAQAWDLAGPADHNRSEDAKRIRESAYHLDNLASVLDNL